MPGIVYMADAVGTQTETLSIRGLSVGVQLRRIVARELFTRLLIGIAPALVILPIGVIMLAAVRVTAAVAIALLAASPAATLVAMALPWLLGRLRPGPGLRQRSGRDGAVATVIQDLLSLLIYFFVASEIIV